MRARAEPLRRYFPLPSPAYALRRGGSVNQRQKPCYRPLRGKKRFDGTSGSIDNKEKGDLNHSRKSHPATNPAIDRGKTHISLHQEWNKVFFTFANHNPKLLEMNNLNGAGYQSRTDDLLITNQLLYH